VPAETDCFIVQAWLLPLLETARVTLLPLSLAPARVWNNSTSNEQSAVSTLSFEEHLDACIAACEQALGLKVQYPGHPDPVQLGSGEQNTTAQHRLIVHNLFALEAFHIAEAFNLPSVAVSACLPYPPPASFQARFQAAYPQLYKKLEQQGVCWSSVTLQPVDKGSKC